MAFPTIPTAAGGDLLATPTTTASTTHTFPNLSSLDGGGGPNAGDLLIAVCVQYQGGTSGNQYSSWGASFTETADLSTVTALDQAVGVAHKVATGSESGTFTVTSANSFRSVNFLMRIPAGTWHGTTIPEVSAATRATGAVADPASFDPAGWAAEDTLWIAVAGHSETTTTGTPPVLTASPTNYSGDLIEPRAADAVGHITAGVGFRQLNASSEDVGTWSATNAIRGNGIAVVVAVRPLASTPHTVTPSDSLALADQATPVLSTETAVARISFEAAGNTPDTQTDHALNIRARVTSGAGTIRAALYEGASNRSGDLESSALTTSLADYVLEIADVDAANITDYSNLELRLWGYAAGGGSIVFEVAEATLSIPAGSGIGYTEEPADSVALTDARAIARGKAVADSVVLADARTMTRGKALADSVALADARAIARGKALSDSLGLADARAITRGKVLADTLGLADQATPDLTVGGASHTVEPDDSVAVSDLFSRVAVYARAQDDGLALADATTDVQGKALADALALTDQLTKAFTRALADTVALADVATPAMEGDLFQQVDDLLALADLLTRVATYTRSLADSLAVTDARALTQGKTLADTVALTDGLITETGIGVTIDDALVLTDSFFRLATYVRTPADSIELADEVTPGSGIPLALADLLSLADAQVIFNGVVTVLMDPIYTGRVADTHAGAIDGREQGSISDTVAGLIPEEVEV